VVFDGTVDTKSVADIAKVQGVEIAAGYEGTVFIRTAEGAESTLEVTNTFSMAGGAITSPIHGKSTLLLSGASLFTWTDGVALNMYIMLGSSTNHDVTGKIAGVAVALPDSRLVNYGKFTWAAGTIMATTNRTAEIINEPGGTFEVQSTGAFWVSVDGQAQNAGSFTNRGTLHFNTGGVRIAATFRNTNNGIVRVYPGQVQFDHEAEQTGGTFELRGGTVKVASNQVLGIRDGTLTGAGTIDGNLNLGYDGGPATAVTIRPGIESAIGTIEITQSWQMFSSSGQTWIRIDDNGNTSKIKATAGWAKLAGVLWIENSKNDKPTAGESREFLTAHLGFDGTNFSHKGVAYWGCWADPNGGGKYVKWSLPAPTGNSYSLVSIFASGS
jgi:hypothetical protein